MQEPHTGDFPNARKILPGVMIVSGSDARIH